VAVQASEHELEERLQRLQLLPPVDRIPSLPRGERVAALAQLIQASDDVLETLPPGQPGETSMVEGVRQLAKMVRGMAFQFMCEVNPEQAWFWTEEWQAGEREVDANQAAGRGTFLGDDAAFDAHLRALRPDLADV
jgi:hypothetical protein